MNYMDFDPQVIRERNEQMRGEVRWLRLEGRLGEGHGLGGWRIVALARRGVLPLLRVARLAG